MLPGFDSVVGRETLLRKRAIYIRTALFFGVPIAQNDRLYCRKQFVFGTRFHDIPQRAQTESFFHHIGGGFLSHKDYFGFRRESANFPGGLESIQTGEPDVQQDQVRMQFFRFRTASNPSDTSPMTCTPASFSKLEHTNLRKGRKSSTTRTEWMASDVPAFSIKRKERRFLA